MVCSLRSRPARLLVALFASEIGVPHPRIGACSRVTHPRLVPKRGPRASQWRDVPVSLNRAGADASQRRRDRIEALPTRPCQGRKRRRGTDASPRTRNWTNREGKEDVFSAACGGITAVQLLKPAAFAFGFKLLLIAAAVRLVWTLLRKKPVVPNLRRGIGRLLQLPVRLYEPELARVDPQQPRDDRADLRDPAAGTIVDNPVVISETGALGAGSSSPEMRANQPLAINVEGLDVRGTSVGRRVPSPCSSRDGRPVRVPLLRRGPPLRHPACSGLLRVGQPAFVDRVPDAERTQGRPTDAVCKDLCRWDPDGIGSADKEVTEFSNGGNRNE